MTTKQQDDATQELAVIRQGKKHLYEVRTKYLDANQQPIYINHLIKQNSPYLLQHAHNPVNWYAWSAEAFEQAQQQNKPIFLSIGYSTCHWCHVMEEESFDDEQVAEVLNQYFICIKVDREEHPDIDDLYMTGVQIMTGQGGWPMSSFLNHAGQPFYAGTYFNKQQFMQILQQLHEAWHSDIEHVNKAAEQIANKINLYSNQQSQVQAVKPHLIQQVVEHLENNFDEQYGGFYRAPKFPHETSLLLLLDHIAQQPCEVHEKILQITLDKMAQGGLYDQIAGGFHRYSVDPYWLVPHFEKMLYNQAQLSLVYLRAYEVSADESYQRIAEQTLQYVIRDMTDEQGGFYSATDADSEGEEGTFFVWSIDEVRQHLSAADASLAIELYGMTAQGNFEGSNILFLPKSLLEFSLEKNMDLQQLHQRINAINSRLYQLRKQREHPLRDDKIITSWNSMMVISFVEAYRILAQEKYLLAAEQAAEFLYQKNWHDEKLYRINLHGERQTLAPQEDYAYFALALLYLSDVTGKSIYLTQAEAIINQMHEYFWHGKGGYLASLAEQATPLIAQAKNATDGAIAAGNAIALKALLMLQQQKFSMAREQTIQQLILAFAEGLNKHPASHATFISALQLHQGINHRNIHHAAEGHIRITTKHQAVDLGQLLQINIHLSEGWKLQDIEKVCHSIALVQKSNYKIKSVVQQNNDKADQNLIKLNVTLLQQGKIESAINVTKIKLKLQACNQQHCLAEEEKILFNYF